MALGEKPALVEIGSGFVWLLQVHNDGEPELLHFSSPFGGPEVLELVEHGALHLPQSLTLVAVLLSLVRSGNAQKW